MAGLTDRNVNVRLARSIYDMPVSQPCPSKVVETTPSLWRSVVGTHGPTPDE